MLLRHEVAHDGVNVLSQPPPLPADEARDRTSELAQTADFESRANRVVRTYSPSGFAKDRVPPSVWGDMSTYYYNNRRSTVTEEWYKKGKGIYVNWYEVDAAMIFMPWDRKTKWHDALQPLVEAWANETLEKTDIYGMRVYHDGATLLQHVDREDTHALSLIINVAQSGVREPWPVHIRDHRTDEDHEVFLEPGELLFYESARCMHGRLKPLRGDFFVNLFAHYRPNGNPNWWRQPNPAPACAETAGDGIDRAVAQAGLLRVARPSPERRRRWLRRSGDAYGLHVLTLSIRGARVRISPVFCVPSMRRFSCFSNCACAVDQGSHAFGIRSMSMSRWSVSFRMYSFSE